MDDYSQRSTSELKFLQHTKSLFQLLHLHLHHSTLTAASRPTVPTALTSTSTFTYNLYFQISDGCGVPDCPYCKCWSDAFGGLPIERDILQQLEKYGFPTDYAVKCLQLNKHNHVTTTYYLL